MAQAKEGDTVKVHYTGTLEDGTVFDSSVDREPLEFTIGGGQMISGFDKAVIGMRVEETKKIAIDAQEAYGPRQDELVFPVERAQFPSDYSPELGQYLEIQRNDGETSLVSVCAFTETHITLDANHPLAGQNLNFELKLVAIA